MCCVVAEVLVLYFCNSILQIYPCAQSMQTAQGKSFAEVLQDDDAHVDAIDLKIVREGTWR